MPSQSRVERWLERPDPSPAARQPPRDKRPLRVVSGSERDPEPRRRTHERRQEENDWPPPPRRARKAPRPKAYVLIPLIAVLGLSLAYMATRPGALATILPAFAPAAAERQAPPPAATEAPPDPAKAQARMGEPSAAAQPAPATAPIPDVAGLVVLIRNTIVALDQANVTGNYSVLREIASPTLHADHTPARLSEIFTELRTSKVDLASVAVVNPRLNQDPAIDERGMLRLVGFVPLAAGQVDFDLTFQLVDARWRLFGIGLKPTGAVEAKSLPSGVPALPDEPTMVALIRSSILALNQANMTGNYSVLRDMAAPGFQEGNSFAKLSDTFAELRAREIDFAPVAVIDPRLFRPPAIDEKGRLRLSGYFPSQPEQVNFDLAFQIVEGQWRLFGIGLNTSREVPVASVAPPSGAANPDPADAGRQMAESTAEVTATVTPPIPRQRPAL